MRKIRRFPPHYRKQAVALVTDLGLSAERASEKTGVSTALLQRWVKRDNHNQKTSLSIEIARLRKDFPGLQQSINGLPLVYLDNAATTQSPRCVIQAMTHYYSTQHANVHRGAHQLSEQATQAFEEARDAVRGFINARSCREIIFTRGTTEAINLVAQSFGRTHLKADDEVLISRMEHHSNIVPWQIACEQAGAKLVVAPFNAAGELMLDEFERCLSPKTKLVALSHVSNALGTINPVKQIIELAHAKGIPVLVDGAQGASHLTIDVQDLDCDFYAISGHKMHGPTGIGVLYGREEILETLPPYQGGGEMTLSLDLDAETRFNELPYRFEAGTPNISGAIGLKAAIDYLQGLDRKKIRAYESQLLDYATQKLKSTPGVNLIGTARHKASILSFTLDNIHPHDIGTILDSEGVAIRAGHHCAMPVMKAFGVPATARASLAFYNTFEDIDRLIDAIESTQEIFCA